MLALKSTSVHQEFPENDMGVHRSTYGVYVYIWSPLHPQPSSLCKNFTFNIVKLKIFTGYVARKFYTVKLQPWNTFTGI